jgi:uncharacterized protein (DUF58 family)
MRFKTEIAKRVSELELAARKLEIKNIIWKLIFRGKGLEFEGYRKFMPDDDANWIDWRASKKTDDLLVKVFKEERDLKIYFLVDVSSGMIFGSSEKLKSEYAAELVCALSHLVITSGDNAGIVLYTDRIVKIIQPGKGLRQFFAIQSEILNEENYGGKSDLGKVLSELGGIFDSSINSVFIVSDFLKVKNEDETQLKTFGKRFETIAVIVRDMRDMYLPDNIREVTIRDPDSGKEMIIDPKLIRERYEDYTTKQSIALKQLFIKSQLDNLELMTDKPFVLPLISFLKSRIERRKYVIPGR